MNHKPVETISFSMTGRYQALYQFLALCLILGISVVGGSITGFILNFTIWDKLDENDYFEDGKVWEMDSYQVGKTFEEKFKPSVQQLACHIITNN